MVSANSQGRMEFNTSNDIARYAYLLYLPILDLPGLSTISYCISISITKRQGRSKQNV